MSTIIRSDLSAIMEGGIPESRVKPEVVKSPIEESAQRPRDPSSPWEMIGAPRSLTLFGSGEISILVTSMGSSSGMPSGVGVPWFGRLSIDERRKMSMKADICFSIGQIPFFPRFDTMGHS